MLNFSSAKDLALENLDLDRFSASAHSLLRCDTGGTTNRDTILVLVTRGCIQDIMM